MKTREICFVSIALFYIAYMVFPFLESFTHIPEWITCLSISVLIFLLYPGCLRRSFIIWFLMYFIVLLLYSVFGHPFHINGLDDSLPAYRRLVIETAWIVPNLLVCSTVMGLNNKAVYKILAQWILVLLILSIVLMLPSLLTYGRIMRENLEEIQRGGNELAAILPGYTLMSCYAYYVPVLCYGVRANKGLTKMLFGIFILLFAYAIVKTEITTSFIALVLLLLITLVYPKGRYSDLGMNRFFSLLFVALVIWLLYEAGLVLWIVDKLVDIYEGTAAQTKFIEFHNLLSGDRVDGNLSLRKHLRDMSLQCFYEKPMFGTTGVGEHSSLLDRLGSMGLVGFLPYFLMLVTNIKSWSRMMPDFGTRYFYYSGIGIVFMFLYVKGLYSGEGLLFTTTLLPVSIIGIYYITHYSDSRL